MMSRALSISLLFLWTVYLSSAAATESSTRQFSGKDLVGEFDLSLKHESCPNTITHASYTELNTSATKDGTTVGVDIIAKEAFSIPHSQISQNGVTCTDGGSLQVLDWTINNPFTVRQSADQGFQSFNLLSILGSLVSQNATFLYGVEQTARECGVSRMESGFAFIFLDDERAVSVRGINLEPGYKHMIAYTPTSSEPCVYSAKHPMIASKSASCFPADATVNLADGNVRRMDEVAVGDRVQVSSGVFSEVFMFTHRDVSAVAQFMEVHTAEGNKLQVTPGHIIYVNGELSSADSVRVADVVELGSGKSDVVTSVRAVYTRGIFNPQTVHGDVVVNGIRCSTYTRAVEPVAAHSLLAPLRALFRAVGKYTKTLDLISNVVMIAVSSQEAA